MVVGISQNGMKASRTSNEYLLFHLNREIMKDLLKLHIHR